MLHRLKVILFVLAFNIIGFAEGYLLREMGLQWLLPVILVTALGAVLLSRRFLWSPKLMFRRLALKIGSRIPRRGVFLRRYDPGEDVGNGGQGAQGPCAMPGLNYSARPNLVKIVCPLFVREPEATSPKTSIQEGARGLVLLACDGAFRF